ncbi:uncharacterized protein LOC122043602 [Zingiber officinale]|uniref:Uncharacterized protein n=1 Tax=Zingiber officinale TaxID=94328 RepID=A0A8J5IG25_ZINOF|nr:uncharacterized protein LOC122043602 [Zingiber officinale]KAG6534376.1 hypothetical protein ZIOFF_008262 [Zingiber officinale]
MKESFELNQPFTKCIRWQLEETTDPLHCPFHYFCASFYHGGDYPPSVDLLVFFFALASFLSAVAFTLLDFAASSAGELNVGRLRLSRRHLLPSGPVGLPLAILVLSHGHSINTIYPFLRLAPALLHVVYVSALAFRNRSESEAKYGILEATTVSGILHASKHLDSVIFPYYTGLEAAAGSTPSGACASCVCRKAALAATGGGHRGCSRTTVAVAGAVCARMVCRVMGEGRWRGWMRNAVEGVGWGLVARDSLRLMARGGGGVAASRTALDVAVHGGVSVLVLLNLARILYKFSDSVATKKHRHCGQRKIVASRDYEEIV